MRRALFGGRAAAPPPPAPAAAPARPADDYAGTDDYAGGAHGGGGVHGAALREQDAYVAGLGRELGSALELGGALGASLADNKEQLERCARAPRARRIAPLAIAHRMRAVARTAADRRFAAHRMRAEARTASLRRAAARFVRPDGGPALPACARTARVAAARGLQRRHPASPGPTVDHRHFTHAWLHT